MGRFLRGSEQLQDAGTFQYQANTRQTLNIDMPQDLFIKRLWIELRGSVQISAVTVLGRIQADAIANILKSIEVLIDGKPLKLDGGAGYFRVAQGYDMTDGVNDGLVSSAAGSYIIHAAIPIALELDGSKSPIDTILVAGLHKKMTINLTWGDATSILIGNTSTVGFTNLAADVYMMLTDPFPITPGHERWYYKEQTTSFQVVANSPSFPMPIDYEDGSIIRYVHLATYDGNDLSDAILTNLTLKLNGKTETPLNTISDLLMRAQRKHKLGVDTLPAGRTHIEFTENGLVMSTGLGAGVPAGQISSIRFEGAVTLGAGATTIVARVGYIVPPSRFGK